ncbi:phosphopantetheine-binding protein [Streptomyces sp. NPDC045431]|uniref:phosphopantetheine-binding protein n=1 Tax=Streptomyces sp. NPDC045431 TaxID=3155613 RepID=UPI0034002EC4
MYWDQRFEELLREYLPFLTAEDDLTPDTALRDAGLDSLATVELLGALEAAYDVKFMDEALKPETFATPASLWGALRSMTGASTS